MLLDNGNNPCYTWLVRPIGNKILIEPAPTKECSAGGIVTPEQYRTRDITWDGLVVALGSGDRTRKGVHVPFEVAVGNRVMVNRYNVAVHHIDGKEMWLAKPGDIVAIVSDDTFEPRN